MTRAFRRGSSKCVARFVEYVVASRRLSRRERIVHAGAFKSAPLAKQLAAILATRHLDAFGAVDPSDPHRVAAVLHISGTQLLVIAADFDDPASAHARVTSGQYRDLYLDLHAARNRRHPLFVEDMGADGLRKDHHELPDTVRESDGFAFQQVATHSVCLRRLPGLFDE